MRTNYNDSSNNRGGRYSKRSNGGSGGGRRSSSGSNSGRRNPGSHSGNGGSINISSVTATRNKYLDMAKEALSHGNRVEAENYFQHAEHYSKLLNSAMGGREEQNSNNSGNGGHQRRNNYNSSQPQEKAEENAAVSPGAAKEMIATEIVAQAPLEIQPEQ